MDLPTLPVTESEIPTFTTECEKVLDYLTTLDRSDALQNREYTTLGVQMHGQMEVVAATWPHRKTEVFPVMRRALYEVLGVGKP